MFFGGFQRFWMVLGMVLLLNPTISNTFLKLGGSCVVTCDVLGSGLFWDDPLPPCFASWWIEIWFESQHQRQGFTVKGLLRTLAESKEIHDSSPRGIQVAIKPKTYRDRFGTPQILLMLNQLHQINDWRILPDSFGGVTQINRVFDSLLDLWIPSVPSVLEGPKETTHRSPRRSAIDPQQSMQLGLDDLDGFCLVLEVYIVST